MDGGPDADSWQQVAELLEGEVADPNRFCKALLVDLLHALPSLLNESTMGSYSSESEVPTLLPPTLLVSHVVHNARDDSAPAIAKTEGKAESVEIGEIRGMHRAGAGRLKGSKQATKDTKLFKGKVFLSVMSKGTGPLQQEAALPASG